MQAHNNKPRSTDEQVLAFWQAQLRESTKQPWLAGLLLRRRSEVSRRFNIYYARLLALPFRWRRAIRRKLSLGLAGAALLLALGGSGIAVPRAHAAGINVDGVCTLADAIDSANGDAVVGSCTAGSGPDTLYLMYDPYLQAALPAITTIVTVEGGDHLISRDPSYANFSIFSVGTAGDLTLNNATVSGGSSSNGGGVYVYGGALTVNRSTISGNAASSGGGIYSYGGVIKVNRSTISGNTGAIGGGIFGDYSQIDIEYSTISGNMVTVYGGGIYSIFGTTNIKESTISGNSATLYGGGLMNSDNYAILSNTTVSDNTADTYGGGIYNSGSDGKVRLNRSIISGNSATRGAEIDNTDGYAVYGGNFNVIGYDNQNRSENFTPSGSDIVPGTGVLLADVLGPLSGAAGGPTETHPLVIGSPAIDVVPNADSNTYDQRLALRNYDGDGLGDTGNEGDSGAFEYGSEPVAITIQSLSATASEPSALAALAAGGLLASTLAAWRRFKRKPVANT